MQCTAVVNNLFGVLTAAVAPAILTNASSVLALGTSNRLARVVDRTRVVAAEMSALKPESPDYAQSVGWNSPLAHLFPSLCRLVSWLHESLDYVPVPTELLARSGCL